jgi:hypothetical protein
MSTTFFQVSARIGALPKTIGIRAHRPFSSRINLIQRNEIMITRPFQPSVGRKPELVEKCPVAFISRIDEAIEREYFHICRVGFVIKEVAKPIACPNGVMDFAALYHRRR